MSPVPGDGQTQLPAPDQLPRDSTPAGRSGATPVTLAEPVAAPAEQRYTIVRHIASGGMGEVYEAFDRDLGRPVAMKKIGLGLVGSAESAERFRREALAAAGLDHPNIVPVYDTGRHEGRAFFTMAFVDGESLSALVRARGPLAPDEALRLFRPVVEAVAYAHDRHLVHRDLKPENVLVDGRGRPRVTDFGLARNLLDPGDLTGSGQPLGTPRFMAPEQVRPAVGSVGPATDVYALGGVLVFLLTGEGPIAADSLPEMLLNVLDRPPTLPRDRRPDVSDALNEVCRRCLAKSPADRYPDAGALRDALADVSPAATPAAAPPARSRRLLAALAAGLLVAVVAAGINKLSPRNESGRTAEKPNATPVVEPAGKPDGAKGDDPPVKDGPKPSAPPAPADGPKKGVPPAPRTDPELHTLTGHSGRVWLSFAPDGRALLSWGDDATLRVWDVTTGKQVKNLFRDRTEAMAVRWSPDGKTLAVALASGSARVYTLPDWEEKVVYTDPAQGVTAVAFAPDGGRLAVGTDGGGLKLFDTKTWEERAECVGHAERVLARALFFSADGARLVSGSRDDTVRVWDAATGKKLYTLADRKGLLGVLPAPDPDRLTAIESGTGTHHVRVLDLKAGRVVKDFGEQWVSDYALSADGKVLWSVGGLGLHAWDLAALRAAGETDTIRGDSLAFVPGANRLLVGQDSPNRTRLVVCAVDRFRVDRLRTVQMHRTDVTSVAVSADGRLAASGDEGGTIKVWDVPTLTRP